jgi:hypothetical protein
VILTQLLSTLTKEYEQTITRMDNHINAVVSKKQLLADIATIIDPQSDASTIHSVVEIVYPTQKRLTQNLENKP